MRAAQKRCPQSERRNCPVRTFFGQGGTSALFGTKKPGIFRNLCWTYKEGWANATFWGQGGGISFSWFCANVFYGRSLDNLFLNFYLFYFLQTRFIRKILYFICNNLHRFYLPQTRFITNPIALWSYMTLFKKLFLMMWSRWINKRSTSSLPFLFKPKLQIFESQHTTS